MTAMISAWAVTYLIHSTLLIGVVWLASRWVRSVPARDVLWKIALTGGVVTATLQFAVPLERVLPAAAPQRVTVPILATPRVEPQPERGDRSLTRVGDASPAVTVPRGSQQSAERPGRAGFRSVDPQALLHLVWIGGALLLVTRLLLGRNRLLADLADRRELVLGNDRALVDALCRTAGCARVVRLTESSVVRSPMAMLGWEIVVPKRIFARLSDEQRRTILAHELAHLTRRDPLWLAAAEVLNAVLFFQPLNRLVRAKLKETAEFLCDDAAVMQTGDRQALVETLAELAAHVVPMPASVAAMAEGGSSLIVRVTRVLRAQRAPDLPLRLRSRLAIAIVPLAALVVFAPGVVPALSKREAPAVKRGTRVAPAAPLDATAPVVVSAAFAPLPSQRISSEATAALLKSTAPPAPSAPAAPSAVPAPAANEVPSAAVVEATMPRTAVHEGRFNGFDEGVLTNTFYTDNGFTRVRFTARRVEIATDASWIRFTDRSGSVKTVETSERGPKREAEVKAGRDREPVYRYVVGGVEQPWDMDAQRLLASGWLAEEAYEQGTVASCSTKPVATSSAQRKTSHWNSSVELTGTRDGQPLLIRVRAIDFKYDTATGEPLLGPRGSLRVEERVGQVSRVFTMDRDQTFYTGKFAHSEGLPKEWLARVLRERTDAPEVLIRAITR